jgi:nicotinamide mononucleotide transporter
MSFCSNPTCGVGLDGIIEVTCCYVKTLLFATLIFLLQVLAPGLGRLHLLRVFLFESVFWLRALVLNLGPLGTYPTTYLELLGVATGFLCVALTVRQNIWCWPIGIVSAVAYAFLFWTQRLYADAYLQVFFIGTSGYGWAWWLRGGPNHSRAPVSSLSAQQRWIWGVATLFAVVTVGGLHARFTNADLPYWDALTSGTSVTAQLLMMRKKAECWPLWIGVDVLSVGIYVYKSLFPTAVLYALFLVLAALGWLEWNQSLRSQKRNHEASTG